MINCLEKFNLDKKIAYMVDEFGFIGSKELICTNVLISPLLICINKLLLYNRNCNEIF